MNTEPLSNAEWKAVWEEFDNWYESSKDPDWPFQKRKIEELVDAIIKDR